MFESVAVKKDENNRSIITKKSQEDFQEEHFSITNQSSSYTAHCPIVVLFIYLKSF